MEYKDKLNIANSYINSKCGLGWDDLSDINSLHDCEDKDIIIEYCDARLEEDGFNDLNIDNEDNMRKLKLIITLFKENDKEENVIEQLSDATVTKYVVDHIDNPIEIDYLLGNLVHDNFITIETTSIDKLRMLDYLKANLNNIELEDLEHIINNK